MAISFNIDITASQKTFLDANLDCGCADYEAHINKQVTSSLTSIVKDKYDEKITDTKDTDTKITEINALNGVLLFIPISLHIIIDSLPRRATKNHYLRALHASSAFLGAVAASFIAIGEAGNIALLGLIGGALLYTVIRESLPREMEGKPLYFITGVLIFTVLIMILWNIGF